MAETEQPYGIRKASPILPVRDLLIVPHRGKELIVSYSAFGPNSFSANIEEMQKTYTHSQELPQISFREPTTTESISAAAYEFEKRAKPEIFEINWLEAGWILRRQEGVFLNLPRDANGNLMIDEKELKKLIDKAEKIKVEKGNIYLGANDFGFAEYESFQRGVQDCDTFAQGGLARVIENTNEKFAPNLRVIASPRNYSRGIKVWGFDAVEEPALRVVGLYSGRGLDGGGLCVGGFYWVVSGDCDGGYAFGVRQQFAR